MSGKRRRGRRQSQQCASIDLVVLTPVMFGDTNVLKRPVTVMRAKIPAVIPVQANEGGDFSTGTARKHVEFPVRVQVIHGGGQEGDELKAVLVRLGESENEESTARV